MEAHFDAVIAAPVGFLGLCADSGFLVRVEFLGPQAVEVPPRDELLREAQRQLAAWFIDPAFQFTMPCRLDGTVFQRKVWKQIAAIPCGAVRTYSEIAKTIGSAPRPVGGACGANPLPIVVPCHRVVAAHGIGGFNARRDGLDWLPIKRWLLQHER